MENKNKCFFSISLENGITITGKNSNEVKNFLADLSIICSDYIKDNENKIKYKCWQNYVRELKFDFDKAWATIYNNQNEERE